MKTKKIFIIIYSLTTGGAEKQAIVDANALLKRGHDVTVGYAKDGNLRSLLNSDVKLLKIITKMEICASMQVLIHFLKNNYDIVHAHMFWGEKVAAIPAKLTKCKLYFNEHGLGIWRKWYHTAIMRFISLFADKIINSCNATKNNRIKLDKIPQKKLITIYNSFDLEKHKIENMKISKKKFTIGFLGRFHSVKRIPLFLRLADLLKDKIDNFEFVLVGDGEEKDNIIKELKEKYIDKYFVMPGFIINPIQYIKQFDIFFLPSEREAFSVALLEVSSQSIPSIVFDVGGNGEIIKDGETGFVLKNNDIQGAFEKILFLYSNPDVKNQMGHKAMEFVIKNFSVEKRITKLEKLYSEKK